MCAAEPAEVVVQAQPPLESVADFVGGEMLLDGEPCHRQPEDLLKASPEAERPKGDARNGIPCQVVEPFREGGALGSCCEAEYAPEPTFQTANDEDPPQPRADHERVCLVLAETRPYEDDVRRGLERIDLIAS